MTNDSAPTRTQVGIIGAGPAGLFLARLLQLQGIDSIVLEDRDRPYVESRVRAGILEQGTVDTLREIGVAERMERTGIVHGGTQLRFDGTNHHIDFEALTGRKVMVYGQQEVVKDLIAQRVADDLPIHFGVSEVQLHDLGGRPRITYLHEGRRHEIVADFIAGCDGSHGVSRSHIPAGYLTEFERVYPFAWFGILANAHPSSSELIYAHSPRGFALHSLRSDSVVRNYLQVAPGTDPNAMSDDEIWDEYDRRFALRDEDFRVNRGEITERVVTPMRSSVCTPMRYERLFLAGDAAHTVPPTGAKGMNLAVADVVVLAQGLTQALTGGGSSGLDAYSDLAVRRVWRCEHFSWWMTSMLHRFPADHPEGDEFGLQMQLSQLRYYTTSEAAMRSLAENYVGIPFGTPL